MSGERSCELCGGRSQDVVYEVNGFPIVRCRTCRLVFVGKLSAPEDLVALYNGSYWEDPAETGYQGYLSDEARKRHHFRTLAREIEELSPPGELVEIGCGYGYFLDEARRRGWRARGVEPSPFAASQARRLGLDVSPGPFAEMRLEPESLDAVVLWDVIEHLPDPRRTLEHARACLRRGGVLALSTGDIGSLSARLHGRDWSLLTPPWHQFYFSRRTLRRLLDEVGFRLVRLGGDGTVAVDRASRSPRIRGVLADALQHRLVTALARKLGAGMIIFAFARKVE